MERTLLGKQVTAAVPRSRFEAEVASEAARIYEKKLRDGDPYANDELRNWSEAKAIISKSLRSVEDDALRRDHGLF